ncbi:copper-binding protein [uncultured Oxalicibacterium sp.]|uniref:copper-binding protein n=1 Tax=uncultured Oxalicibacterium sp. TaxID=1168540 RepID=UPI0025EDFDAB|nr:copper-binding protein [uncultured Oxalicibacterium sp.]
MKIKTLLVAASLLAGLSLSHAAEESHADHASHASAEAGMSHGEIKKIREDLGKITIKHGPLENLGMPGMTMVFLVKDLAMLAQVKEGDRIRFVADKIDGVYTVTRMEVISESES